MKHIIIEGPDNSGKSTLAERLSRYLGLEIVKSKGREKYPGEMSNRVKRYNELQGPLIFDRHPVVSHGLYYTIETNTPVDLQLIEEFYCQRHLIIYCRPLKGRGMEGHQLKEYDTQEYIEQITQKYEELTMYYDSWGLEKAHHLWRIGDDLDSILKSVEGVLNYA